MLEDVKYTFTHPQLQENYTGVKTARLWNLFFSVCRKNYYFRVKFIAKFVPRVSNLRDFGLNCCVFPVKSVVRGHERVGYERELLILLEKHSNLGQNNANWEL